MSDRSADPYADFLDAASRLAACSEDGVFYFTREVCEDCLDHQFAIEFAAPGDHAAPVGAKFRLRCVLK